MEEFVIDPIPPLTETGGGTLNALFEGCSAEVTEQLTGSWCGDLLQIVDNCPEDYKKIPCCFAPIKGRCRYCKKVFGLDNESFILKNKKGERLEMVTLSLFLKRSDAAYMQYENTEDGVYFKPVL